MIFLLTFLTNQNQLNFKISSGLRHQLSNAKNSLIAIHKCVLGVDGGVGSSSGGVVVVVVGVVGLVIGYWWWRSG